MAAGGTPVRSQGATHVVRYEWLGQLIAEFDECLSRNCRIFLREKMVKRATSGVNDSESKLRSDNSERLKGCSGLRVLVECPLLVRQDPDSCPECTEPLSSTRRWRESR